MDSVLPKSNFVDAHEEGGALEIDMHGMGRLKKKTSEVQEVEANVGAIITVMWDIHHGGLLRVTVIIKYIILWENLLIMVYYTSTTCLILTCKKIGIMLQKLMLISVVKKQHKYATTTPAGTGSVNMGLVSQAALIGGTTCHLNMNVNKTKVIMDEA